MNTGRIPMTHLLQACIRNAQADLARLPATARVQRRRLHDSIDRAQQQIQRLEAQR